VSCTNARFDFACVLCCEMSKFFSSPCDFCLLVLHVSVSFLSSCASCLSVNLFMGPVTGSQPSTWVGAADS